MVVHSLISTDDNHDIEDRRRLASPAHGKTMPRPTMPPTPAPSGDLLGREGKRSSALEQSFTLPPPAMVTKADVRPNGGRSRRILAPSREPEAPLSPTSPVAEDVPTRRQGAGGRPAREKENFTLPPPPARSRKIIQMKPRPHTATASTGAGAKAKSAAGAPSAAGASGAGRGKQPSTTSAAGRKVARKTAHSLIERRRRSKMNEEFGMLRQMIPACRDQEMHKLAILQVRLARHRLVASLRMPALARLTVHPAGQHRVSPLPRAMRHRPGCQSQTKPGGGCCCCSCCSCCRCRCRFCSCRDRGRRTPARLAQQRRRRLRRDGRSGSGPPDRRPSHVGNRIAVQHGTATAERGSVTACFTNHLRASRTVTYGHHLAQPAHGNADWPCPLQLDVDAPDRPGWVVRWAGRRSRSHRGAAPPQHGPSTQHDAWDERQGSADAMRLPAGFREGLFSLSSCLYNGLLCGVDLAVKARLGLCWKVTSVSGSLFCFSYLYFSLPSILSIR